MFSKIKTLKASLTLLLGLSLVAGCASAARIDSKADAQWTQLVNTIPQLDNEELTLHVRALTGAILLAADENPDAWQVAIFDSPDTVNAFALPNRRIGVFTGLLAITANNDQLAAVIGHEIAHVRLSHAQERINRGIVPNVLSGVAKLPGAVTDIDVLERGGEITSGAIRVGTVLPFGRAQELEADREGLAYMAKAGFDPEEAANFWRRMAEVQSRSIEVLSTHPSSDHRVRELEKAVRELNTQ